jgi:hypothetical protein
MEKIKTCEDILDAGGIDSQGGGAEFLERMLADDFLDDDL